MDSDASRFDIYTSVMSIIIVFIGNAGVPSPEEWLASNIPNEAFIGFDPNLISDMTFWTYSKV